VWSESKGQSGIHNIVKKPFWRMAFRTTMIGRALILFLVVLYLVFVSATMARAQWTAEKANQCGVFLDDLLLIDSVSFPLLALALSLLEIFSLYNHNALIL